MLENYGFKKISDSTYIKENIKIIFTKRSVKFYYEDEYIISFHKNKEKPFWMKFVELLSKYDFEEAMNRFYKYLDSQIDLICNMVV